MNQVQESLFHEQNYLCKETRLTGPLSKWPQSKAGERGRSWAGQECITGEGTPGPARGSRRGNVGEGLSGSQSPCPELFQLVTTLLGREKLGPVVRV